MRANRSQLASPPTFTPRGDGAQAAIEGGVDCLRRSAHS
jgi:hypothetical protein